MTKKVKMDHEARKLTSLKIGLKLAKKVGVSRVALSAVAAEQNITAPMLFHIFESREGFGKELKKYAKAQGVTLPAGEPTVRAARAVTPKKPVPPVKAPVGVGKKVKQAVTVAGKAALKSTQVPALEKAKPSPIKASTKEAVSKFKSLPKPHAPFANAAE